MKKIKYTVFYSVCENFCNSRSGFGPEMIMPDPLRQQSSWSGSTTLLSVFLYDTYRWPCVRARPLHWRLQASNRRSRRGWSPRSSPSRDSRRPPSAPGTFGCCHSYRRNTLCNWLCGFMAVYGLSHYVHLVWSQDSGLHCTYSGSIWSTLFYSVLTEAMSDLAL